MNKIIDMRNSAGVLENSIVPDVFGLSYDTGLEGIMDTSARNTTISTMIDFYIRLENTGKKEQADRVRQHLMEMVGGESRILPELESRM